jgi:hypothetical protein
MNYDPNEKLAKRSYRRDGHGQKEGGVRRAGNGTKLSKTGGKKNTLRKTTAKKRNAKETYTLGFVKNFLLLVVAAPSSRGIRTVRN